MRRATVMSALLPLALLGACGGDREGAPGASAGAGEQGTHATFAGGPAGGTLIALMDREPDALNPLTYDSYPASQINHLIFRTLARRDTTLGGYTPDLATSWELSPDSGSVILKLRNDVKWHDGRPVTAEDVVWSIQMQKSEEVASPRVNDIAGIGEVTAQDSFTVVAQLARRGPYNINSLLEVMPAPKHLLDTVAPGKIRFSSFGQQPVGNGLFKFGDWKQGQQITLTANEDAPEGRPSLDRIVARFVPDVNAAMTEVLSEQAGLLKITPEQAERVRTAGNVKLHHAARVRPAWIAWNTSKEPVNDPRVRQALLMGINREQIVQGLFGEEGEVALTPIPTGLREHCASVKPLPYNPQQAKQLLAQAGWQDTNGDGIADKGGKPLRIEVDYISTDPVRADVLVASQAMLRQIGVELVLKPYESTAWVERLRNRQFVGSLWGWGYGPGVVGPNAEVIFHSRSIPPKGPNFAGYSNPRVDALIDSMLVTYDETRSRQMWCEIEQHLVNDAVYAPIFLDPELFAVHSRFENVKFRGVEWWEDVPFWHVPEGKRLPRDRS